MEVDQQVISERYQLAEDNELRIEVGQEEIIVELIEGTAEVFGTSLGLHKRYNIPPGWFLFYFIYKLRSLHTQIFSFIY